MWSNLPFDLLSDIFSYLSPESLARAKSACRNWHHCSELSASARQLHHPPWFLAMPTRRRGLFCCYAHNPSHNNWHMLSLDFIHTPIRPIAPINGLILSRLIISSSTSLLLAICNPFTGQFKQLPALNISRTNPAVGVIQSISRTHSQRFQFKIYVAGGMSEEPGGGAFYVPSLEMYDSVSEKWEIAGSIPMAFSVRLTVWTPNESVFCNGILYWITSARAYTVMGFDIETKKWTELQVPLADRLEFAALVLRHGNLTLVGGTAASGGGIGGGDVCVWELRGVDDWSVIEKVPLEFGVRLAGEKGNWVGTKCVGIDGAMCLYRDLESGMIVWKDVGNQGKWEWVWIEGCCSIRGKQIQNLPIKGLLIHPNLAPDAMMMRA